MEMKNLTRSAAVAGMLLLPAIAVWADDEIISTFNSQNVILPSSQYTPDSPYEATVWVFNSGQRYDSQYYNHIWGTPEADQNGKQWFDVDYTLTDSDNIGWQVQTAPFSSDEYYKDHKSYRWVTSEIMGEIYMRRTFVIDSPINSTVYLACGHDDAPSEWYINGVQVHTVADGWNNDEYVLLTDEQKDLIKTDGTENVLAVHVHQNWGGAFADCGLYAADMFSPTTHLATVAKGSWDCVTYTLNYNTDIAVAEAGGWPALDENEDDWFPCIGPFSNDENMFYITEWPSQLRPLLVRRHFNLTEDEISAAITGEMRLTCSYDENPKVYLNGSLIWSASGWSDNNYVEYTLSAENKNLLVAGDNVLAVSLMQGDGGGHIDYGLTTYASYTFTGVANVASDKTENHVVMGVYDLNGRYLGTDTSNLKRGIYIVNGKKCAILK
jgi:hypothetical protein